MSRYNSLDFVDNNSHFELKWKKAPRSVKDERGICLEAIRDQGRGKRDHEASCNIQVLIVFIFWECSLVFHEFIVLRT